MGHYDLQRDLMSERGACEQAISSKGEKAMNAPVAVGPQTRTREDLWLASILDDCFTAE